MLPVAEPDAVHEHRQMFSQRALIVEDIAAQTRLLGKHGIERFA